MKYHTVTSKADERIWALLLAHAGEVFHTARGLPFTYHQKIGRSNQALGELVIDRKEKTITRNTITLAYERSQELMRTEGCVSGPKKLGVFGASYLYPVFLALGICRREKEEQSVEQVYNPYLPLTEHVPDGEPHVFGDRVYIYGSHDRAGGEAYCEDHYVVWSAPVSDLRSWRCEGTSYMRAQDPSNKSGELAMWAPDAARGPDGKYYLYYCLSASMEIGVAISDTPAGPFSFYGHVHYPPQLKGGEMLDAPMPFDPAVLVDEDGRVYLYFGFAPACEKEMQSSGRPFGENSMVAELEPDMVTLKEEPRVLIPGGHHTRGTGFEGHGFFEASSVRKLNGRYYFVYSSHKSHELCYAVSDHPDRDFVYGGTIISNGDIGLNGRSTPVYPMGNNHGGLVQVGDALYIFYHRQTNGTEYSRQGCAEKVELKEDGSIPQVEITSCGLNGGPLEGRGSYPAAIACHLSDPGIPEWIDFEDPATKTTPRVTQCAGQVFLTGIRGGTKVGYKYFALTDADLLTLELRGHFAGSVTVSLDEAGAEQIGEMEFEQREGAWELKLLPIACTPGVHALYFTFQGEGTLDFKRFGFVTA